MPGQNGPDARGDGRPPQKTPERTDANRPVARAMLYARELVGSTQGEFAAALQAVIKVPLDNDIISGWEKGTDGKPYAKNWNFVPAYALLGAAKATGRTVGELLTAAGVEGQEPLADRVAELERRIADLEARLEGWEIEMASTAGRDPGEPRQGDPINLDMAVLRRRVEELFSVLEELRKKQA